MREYVATAKTVEEAIQLGCEALSVDRDDLGVSYEILEMPQKTGFLGLKVTPAKVKVTVETADTEPETTPAAPVAAAEPEPAPAEEAAEQPAAEDAAPAEAETPLDIAADPPPAGCGGLPDPHLPPDGREGVHLYRRQKGRSYHSAC